MDDRLKKLDEIIYRTGVTYGEANAALTENDDDVIRAIVELEKAQQPKNCLGLQQMLEKTKEMKIQIIKDEQKIGEIPAAAGALGLVATCLMPRFAIVGAVSGMAALLSNVNLEISQPFDGNENPANGKGSNKINKSSKNGFEDPLLKEMADIAEQNCNGESCQL